jgi:lipopolysaccharide export system permease protein
LDLWYRAARQIAAENGISMTIIDHYLLRQFTKVLLVSFISLAGLYVVIDVFGNFDELWTHSQRSWCKLALVLLEYYGPRVLQFFDKTSGLLAMLSVVFVVTVLQKTNELTALTAAGVSPARVMLPLLAAAGVVAGLGAANREFGLPQVRGNLASNAQDLSGEGARKCTPRYDIRSDILISGKATRAKNRQIDAPQFRLPPELSEWGWQISAAAAFQQPATAEHPAGYLLKGIKQPENLANLPSVGLDGQAVLYSPHDTAWLAADECFVVSMVSFEHLTVGGAWKQYLSTYELITGLASRSIDPGADVWVTLHGRLVQPLIDFSLVLLCLPLVLTRRNRTILGTSMALVALAAIVYLVTLTCHGLGTNYLLNPLWAAWVPLVVFGPLAYTVARPLWD